MLFAARGGQIEAARALLDAGADVNERLPDGTSALVVAVMNAHYELAALLLDRGADPNADAQGWTALHQIAVSAPAEHRLNLPGPVPTGAWTASSSFAAVGHGAHVNARVKKEPRTATGTC